MVSQAQSPADTATLNDATGSNTLIDRPLDALFVGFGFSLEAKQFKTTTVNGANGTDTAYLFDQPGVANTLVASPDQATLSANNSTGGLVYSNTVNYFSQVVASATAGNLDTASFLDGPNAAIFNSGWNSSAGGNLSTMTGSNSKGRAYNNQARAFRQIQFNPSTSANHPVDQIFLTDSAGKDSLVVSQHSVELSSVQAGYLYDILIKNIAGDTVTASNVAGGTDTKSVAAATDYLLKTTGVW